MELNGILYRTTRVIIFQGSFFYFNSVDLIFVQHG